MVVMTVLLAWPSVEQTLKSRPAIRFLSLTEETQHMAE
jgi:hypothetical protein